MKVLLQTHRARSGKLQFRVVSTDSLEKYILRHRGRAFRKDSPLHLTERIRQAARRLVGIPRRSGKEWKVVALERSENSQLQGSKKWIRREYAPDRGKILLGLVKANAIVNELASAEEVKENSNENKPKINGRMLQDIPQWEGRFWWDATGRVRTGRNRRRIAYSGITADDCLGTEKYLSGLPRKRFKGGWTDLLRQNQDTIDVLSARRNKEFGL